MLTCALAALACARLAVGEGNAHELLRAARTARSVDELTDVLEESAAGGSAEPGVEFRIASHERPRFDNARIGVLLAALAGLALVMFATYHLMASIRRYGGQTAGASVPIDHRRVKRLLRAAEN